MVNLSGLMAVVFLWRFRLRVVPPSPSASCVTRKQSSRKELFSRGLFTVTLNELSERGNSPSLMGVCCFVMQKQFVGRRSFE